MSDMYRPEPVPDLVEQARVELEESAKEPECSEKFGLAALAETRRLIEQRRRERAEGQPTSTGATTRPKGH